MWEKPSSGGGGPSTTSKYDGRLVRGCEVTVQTGLALDVAAGAVIDENGIEITVAAMTVTLGARPTRAMRIDLVFVNSVGTVAVIPGGTARNPRVPDLPAGGWPLAHVLVLDSIADNVEIRNSAVPSPTSCMVRDYRRTSPNAYDKFWLEGKTLGVLGDSLTDYTTSFHPMWWSYLWMRTGVIVTDYGNFGSPVTSPDRPGPIPCFISRYTLMALGFDMILFQGGGNDATFGRPLKDPRGDVNDYIAEYMGITPPVPTGIIDNYNKTVNSQPTLTYNTDYFTGAMQFLIEWAHQTYPGKPIGWVHTTAPNGRYNAAVCKTVCEFYGIPLLDSYATANLNVHSPAVLANYVQADGRHPTSKGQEIVSYAFENLLRTMLGK